MKHTFTYLRAAIIMSVIFYMAMLFTSCASVHHQERMGCYANKSMVGYSGGGYKHATRVSRRSTY